MITDLKFEVTKSDDKQNPIEAKLIAIGDVDDLRKAFESLSRNVIKPEDKK